MGILAENKFNYKTMQANTDLYTPDGLKHFITLSAIVAEELEDLDIISQCVNVRFCGDYDYEDKAKTIMECAFAEISYITIRTLEPKIGELSKDDWTKLLCKVIFNLGLRLGYVYRDSHESQFIYEAETIYDKLKQGKKAGRAYSSRFKKLITPSIGHSYPMSDEDYEELLKDRGLDQLEAGFPVDSKEKLVKLIESVDLTEVLSVFKRPEHVAFAWSLVWQDVLSKIKYTYVKTYSYQVSYRRGFTQIGYCPYLDTVVLRINVRWIKRGMPESWWEERIIAAAKAIANCVCRNLYLKEYEEWKEKLANMRKNFPDGHWGDDEEYRKAYDNPGFLYDEY